MRDMAVDAPTPIASVTRAITIIEFLAEAGEQGTTLTNLSQVLGINKTTAYNTLSTLRQRAWVERDLTTGMYRLGMGTRPIALYYNSVWTVSEMIRPALQSVSKQFNELVHLARLSGFRVMYVDKVEPDRPIRVVSRVGKEVPAVRTALGRALIGSQPNREELISWFFSDPVVSGMEPEKLEDLHHSVTRNFDLLDERGWTQEDGENEKGISCVAVPLNVNGQVQFAISVSTPTERLPSARREVIVHGIADAIARLPKSAGVRVASDPLSADRDSGER